MSRLRIFALAMLGVLGSATAGLAAEEGRRESELARWLRDPAARKPSAHMPRLALQEDEIRALAAYLATLR
jgi:cytochrome c1